jgi:hypothetical protein
MRVSITMPFMAYYLVRRVWPVVVPATIALALLGPSAILRLSITHAKWVASYLHDNSVLLSYGSLGDFTEANPIRFGLINLQVAAYAIAANRWVANVLVLLICSVLGMVWLLSVHRRTTRKTGDELLELGTIVVISLLPVYHRFYDASLLVFPLAWVWTAWPGASKILRRVVLGLILVFLVPGGSMLERFQTTDHWPSVQHSRWWNCLVMPHEVWALLALSCALLYAMAGGLHSPGDILPSEEEGILIRVNGDFRLSPP